jgi:hypothetical protein
LVVVCLEFFLVIDLHCAFAGGCIMLFEGAQGRLSDCHMEENAALGHFSSGGAIALEGSAAAMPASLDLASARLINNRAEIGGAVSTIANVGAVTAWNTTFT